MRWIAMLLLVLVAQEAWAQQNGIIQAIDPSAERGAPVAPLPSVPTQTAPKRRLDRGHVRLSDGRRLELGQRIPGELGADPKPAPPPTPTFLERVKAWFAEKTAEAEAKYHELTKPEKFAAEYDVTYVDENGTTLQSAPVTYRSRDGRPPFPTRGTVQVFAVRVLDESLVDPKYAEWTGRNYSTVVVVEAGDAK